MLTKGNIITRPLPSPVPSNGEVAEWLKAAVLKTNKCHFLGFHVSPNEVIIFNTGLIGIHFFGFVLIGKESH